MSYIYKYNQRSKATVCNGNQCITVYGDAAKIIEHIAVAAAAIIAVALLNNALK